MLEGLIAVAVIVGCSLVVVGVFVAYIQIRSRIIAARDRNRDPYNTPRVSHFPFDLAHLESNTRTPSGFIAGYKLTAYLGCANLAEFRAAEMIKPEHASRPLAAFDRQILSRLLYPNGPWYLLFDWTGGGTPSLCTFFLAPGKRLTECEFDPNGLDLLKAANQLAAKDGWTSHGCSVELCVRIERDASTAIMENYDMLTPAEHLQAESDAKYLRYQEAIVIKAIKLRQDFVQQSTKHQAVSYSITVAIVGTAVVISWKLDGVKHEDLLGFRREGSFSSDMWDETGKNGPLIVDARADSSYTDHPPPGQTHFYTFFLRRWKDRNAHDPLRFAVHVPREDDIVMLKSLLDRTHSKRAEADAEKERRAKILEKTNHAMDWRKEKLRYCKAKAEEINANPSFTPEEKVDLIRAIEEELSEASLEHGA